MKFLIPTEPDDTHAILLKIALEERGHHVALLFTADQPTRQKNSIFIEPFSYRWQSSDAYSTIFDQQFDVVWWRRARRPYLPKSVAHPDDYQFVSRENMLFYESFTHTMAKNAWWVNPKEAAHRANFKILQLRVADECGMKIPITLCSNDPKEIHYFILNHEEEGVVYKPMCSNFWFESDQMKVAYTARVGLLDLPENHFLQSAPGLFQREIKKKYELRVTCFGDYIVAAKLDSQAHPDGQIDWRAIQDKTMQVEPYKLPIAIEDKIRMFMRKLGIVFGSFDFIVTPEDEYIFLEVNEQGQFLWLEEYCPELKLLDIFVHFLLARTIDFKWDERQASYSIDDYREEMKIMCDENMERHVELNSMKAQRMMA